MNVLRLSSPLGADLAFLGTSLKLLMSFIKIAIYLDKIKQEGGERDFLKSFNYYRILSSIVRTFLIQNDAEIFPVNYTWKVAKKGFKIAFMNNKFAMIISFEIMLEK